MRWWHITISSVRRAHLFPDEARRRRAVRAVVRVADRWLLLFCVVDDHVHVVVACDRATAGRICQALILALRPIAGEPLVSHIEPVKSRSHLHTLVGYVLTQTEHHGLSVHPAAYSGSCFQDLIGARRISGCATLLARELPRLRFHHVYSVVGLPAQRITPASAETVRRAGASAIADAAQAALAIGPPATARGREPTLARAAAIHVAERAGITRRDLAWALGLTPQRIGQLARAPADPTLVRAVGMQLSLREVLATTTTNRATGT